MFKLAKKVLLTVPLLTVFYAAQVDAASFTDVPNNHWANSTIQEAVQLGFLKGNGDGTFAPDKNVSRAELATLLSRFFQDDTRTTETFSDLDSSHWATPAIEELINLNVIVPGEYSNAKFEPEKAMSRIEMARWFTRALAVKQGDYTQLEKIIRDSQHTIIPVTEFYGGGLSKTDYGYAGISLGTGLYTGYEDGSFKPNDNTKRSEVATLAIRMNKLLGQEPTAFRGLNEIVEVSKTGTNMLSATKFKYANLYANNTLEAVIDKPLTLNNNVGTAKLKRIIFVEGHETLEQVWASSIYAKMFVAEMKYVYPESVYMYVDQVLIPNKKLNISILGTGSYNGYLTPSRITENVEKYKLSTLPVEDSEKFFVVGKEIRYWTTGALIKKSYNYIAYTPDKGPTFTFYSTY